MEESLLGLLTTTAECDKYTSKLIVEKDDWELKIANIVKSKTNSTGNTKEMKDELTGLETQITAFGSIVPTLEEGSPKRSELVVEISALNHRKLVLTTDLGEKGPISVLDKEMNLLKAKAALQLIVDTLPKVAARKAQLQ